MDVISVLAKIFQRVKEMEAENETLKEEMQRVEKAVAGLADEMGIEIDIPDEDKKRGPGDSNPRSLPCPPS